MTYRLFTTEYNETREQRERELSFCLSVNSRSFDDLYVTGEYERRQKFSDLLTQASDWSGPRDINVIANCDIIIERRWLDMMHVSLGENQVYCLTRWELATMQLWDVGYSQDVWVFRGPPKKNIGGEYWFGVPGCDNRFSWELRAAGYEVLNPSKSIPTWHVHQSRLRTETNCRAHRVPPPYLYLEPCALGEQQKRVEALTLSEREAAFGERRAQRFRNIRNRTR